MDQLLELLHRFFQLLKGELALVPVAPHLIARVVRPIHPWPKKLSRISDWCHLGVSVIGSTTPYDLYAICPQAGCGAVHMSKDVVDVGYCTRLRHVFTESPRSVQLQAESASAASSSAPVAASAAAAAAVGVSGATCHSRLFKDERISVLETDGRNRTMNKVPLQPFPYSGLNRGVQALLLRPGVERKLQSWQSKYNEDGKRKAWTHVQYHDETGWPTCTPEEMPNMSDIQDGELWERYMFTDDNRRFFLDEETASRMNRQARHARYRAVNTDHAYEDLPLEEQYVPSPGSPHPLLADKASLTLALQLNIDWFQPFGNRSYSVGGIYAACLNLPREERYCAENMILLGVLPGPKGTGRAALQGALRPFVAELEAAFDGISMRTADHPHGRRVRMFLFTVACDTPARAEVCGFMGAGGRRGCPCCTQVFPPREGGRKVCRFILWHHEEAESAYCRS